MFIPSSFRLLWRRSLIKKRLREAQRQARMTHEQYRSLVDTIREAKIEWDAYIAHFLLDLLKERDRFERRALELERLLSC